MSMIKSIDSQLKINKITFIMQDSTKDYKDNKINGKNKDKNKSKKNLKDFIIKKFK